MSRDHALARGLGFATALIWGLSFLSIKVAVVVVPPLTLGLARFVVASAILPLLALALREKLRVALRDIPLLALGGFIGVTLYFICENNGILLLSASEASLVVGTIPVVTMLAERIVLGTRLPGRSYLGALLSFVGVGLIVLRSPGASSSPLGFLYMAGAALAWVVYAFVTQPLTGRYGRITVTFWQSLFGMIGFIPFALSETKSWTLPGATVVLHVLYLGIFCSALGYWFYVTSLDVLGPGAASMFINLIPVVSVVAAFFFLGERLAGLQFLGGLVAILGVWLATAPGKTISANKSDGDPKSP